MGEDRTDCRQESLYRGVSVSSICIVIARSMPVHCDYYSTGYDRRIKHLQASICTDGVSVVTKLNVSLWYP